MLNKTHYIAVTGIIRNSDGKFLIAKRSLSEQVFPGKWCVPGGKVEQSDFVSLPKDTKDHWFNVFEKALTREIFEETGLSIKDIGYVSNLAFLRPNGYATIIVSLYATANSGSVRLNNHELVDYAWVSLEEAKGYDLIDNIFDQLIKADKLMSL